MKKSLILTGLTLLALGGILPTTHSVYAEELVSDVTLNVGILPAESAIPIIIAKENGYFEALGLDVDIHTFAAPTDRNVAIQAKELDATIADVMTEATFKQNGIDMVITSDILEDFKVLSSPNSGVTEMEELADKDITLVPNFILEYIMDVYATEGNFTYNIVEITSFSARSEALLNDQVDAAVYTEPQASMLVAQGAINLGSSADAGIKGGTIQFMADVVAERPQDISAFYQAYNQAIDYMNENSAASYAEVLSNYEFPEAMSTYLDSKEVAYPYAQAVPQDQFDNIIEWTVSKGQIDTAYTYDELTNFTFLTE